MIVNNNLNKYTMNKEDKEKLKQSLFYDYSWSSKEIKEFSMHIDDVIEATEQAINFTGSSLELKDEEEMSFEGWLIHNKFEVATPFSYKKGTSEYDVKQLRKLYNMLHKPLIT